jgi:ATP-dependent Clp protease protease subunit
MTSPFASTLPAATSFDGIAIYNRLKQFKGDVTVYIDGLAASIASIIALAGDKIYIGEGALYMVHLPWTFAFGNRMDLDNTVNRLMDVEEQMISIYSKKSGLDRAEVKALLEAETWMGADEAIEKGFVDSKVDESLPIAVLGSGHRVAVDCPQAEDVQVYDGGH